MLEPPSRELHKGCPWELLFAAVDLMINAESIGRCRFAGFFRDLKIRDGEEGRTDGKIQIMVTGNINLDLLEKSRNNHSLFRFDLLATQPSLVVACDEYIRNAVTLCGCP